MKSTMVFPSNHTWITPRTEDDGGNLPQEYSPLFSNFILNAIGS